MPLEAVTSQAVSSTARSQLDTGSAGTGPGQQGWPLAGVGEKFLGHQSFRPAWVLPLARVVLPLTPLPPPRFSDQDIAGSNNSCRRKEIHTRGLQVGTLVASILQMGKLRLEEMIHMAQPLHQDSWGWKSELKIISRPLPTTLRPACGPESRPPGQQVCLLHASQWF